MVMRVRLGRAPTKSSFDYGVKTLTLSEAVNKA
jgi:hypothetical protein